MRKAAAKVLIFLLTAKFLDSYFFDTCKNIIIYG